MLSSSLLSYLLTYLLTSQKNESRMLRYRKLRFRDQSGICLRIVKKST